MIHKGNRKNLRIYVGVLLFQACFSTASAQVNSIVCKFESDSFSMGMPIVLHCEVEKLPETSIQFPRYSLAYAPFDWIRTVRISRKNQEQFILESYDIYLKSFELLQEQSVRFKFGWMTDRDTAFQEVRSDTVSLVRMVHGNPLNTPFRKDQALVYVQTPLDLTNFILWIIILGVVGFTLFYTLKKPVLVWWKLYKLKKSWEQVKHKLTLLEQQSSRQVLYFQQLNSLWKTYLDPFNLYSLGSLTTTELQQVLVHFSFLDTSERAWFVKVSEKSDLVIHAGKELPEEAINEVTQKMATVLSQIYEKKRKAIRYAPDYGMMERLSSST